MLLTVPAGLAASCSGDPGRRAWLERLPALVDELARRWSLVLGPPFAGDEVSAAWVAPATRADGTAAVLKLGMPHFEAEHEIAGLRFWDGEPSVRLLAADEERGAMLLERCEPGTHLRALPEVEQDVLIAGLLNRLWRAPPEPHEFRPLAEMTAAWAAEALAGPVRDADPGLVQEGLRLFEELPRSADRHVLLATDLHAGNVLRARREPWLAIDPKPFVGDPAYDATQHLLNCEERLSSNPLALVARLAELCELDRERVRLWAFARIVTEGGGDWAELRPVAEALAP
jgi:streptomycin 6-kinase